MRDRRDRNPASPRHPVGDDAVPQSPPACRVEHVPFAHAIQAEPDPHDGVGIALAAQERGPRAIPPALVSRTRESSACLRTLALTMDARPAGSCVDDPRLMACLGDPLLR